MKKDWMIKESELDSDQIRVLMSTLDTSCVVSGCAGSGKSILALIKTQRIQNEKGNNYKVIVFTKALCQYMNTGKHELGLKNEFSYYKEWKWKKYLKQYKSGAYWVYERDKDGRMIPYMPSADYIIVDEIQDFSQEEIQEFVAAAKKGFFFFGDTAQSIYEGLKTTIPVNKISSIVPYGYTIKEWELCRNYRLPVPVAKVVQSVGVGLDVFDPSKYKSEERTVPRFIKYNSGDEQIAAIRNMIKRNNLTDVAILLPNNDDVMEVYNKLKSMGGNYELRYNDRGDIRNSKDNLDFSSTNPKVMTYHSAKGLQFETVFLPYIERFSGHREDRKSLYVAMTRTYRNLYVLYTRTLPDPLSRVSTNLYKDTEADQIEDI